MKIVCFLNQNEIHDEITLTPKHKKYHHLKNVLKIKKDDELSFSSGDLIEHIYSVNEVSKALKFIKIKEVTRAAPLLKIILCPAVLKKNSFEAVIKSVCETGVKEIIPLFTEKGLKYENMKRWREAAEKAFEIKKDFFMPAIREPMTLQNLLNELNGKQAVCFHTEGGFFSAEHLNAEKEIYVLCGPESGWTENEIDNIKKSGVKTAKLFNSVLSAETFGPAAVSVLNYALTQKE